MKQLAAKMMLTMHKVTPVAASTVANSTREEGGATAVYSSEAASALVSGLSANFGRQSAIRARASGCFLPLFQTPHPADPATLSLVDCSVGSCISAE